MTNNSCRFNFCPLIIAILLGGIIAALAFGGIITVALITALLPFLLAIGGIIAVILTIIIVNLNNINDNIVERNNCCYCNCCCICPLIRTAIITLVIFLFSVLLGLLVTFTVGTILSALLIFVIATSLIYLFFVIIELIYCILEKICND